MLIKIFFFKHASFWQNGRDLLNETTTQHFSLKEFKSDSFPKSHSNEGPSPPLAFLPWWMVILKNGKQNAPCEVGISLRMMHVD